jgi:starch-binding outer membrane protein, SusD/RagB family
MKYFKILTTLSLVFFLSCSTDLEEKLGGELSAEQAAEITSGTQFLNSAYKQLQQFETQDLIWAMQEHTSDELVGPTRGGDWDDNGIWRQLHQHTWDAGHQFVENTFNNLSNGVFQTIQALSFDLTTSEIAQAQFLQAWFVFHLLDLYGQVPFRDAGEDLREAARVLTGEDAVNLIISNLESAIPNLPTNSSTGIASQAAGQALLAKSYLQKPVWISGGKGFSFDNADLDKVIQNCDGVISAGYSLSQGLGYYDNFRPDNDVNPGASEIIFVSKHARGENGGNIASRWFMTLHYNQNPGGWNGFTTLSDFYSKFDDDNDVRKGNKTLSGLTDVSGLKAGFLQGQQVDVDGNNLQDRLGNLLFFTTVSPIISSGPDLEITGIRGLKYIPDYDNLNVPNNDYVLLRFSDVLLMKAEALLRKGDDGSALAIVNQIRAARNATDLGSIDLASLLDERGRELWWEGWRRPDQIRFDTFLDGGAQKEPSSETYLLFPIPSISISGNPNLIQNPGY